MADSLRSKVEEHLTCFVCLKQLKDPKVLPCLHSYCHDCIVNLAKNAKGSTFNCPNCRLAVKVKTFMLCPFTLCYEFTVDYKSLFKVNIVLNIPNYARNFQYCKGTCKNKFTSLYTNISNC